MKRLCLIFLLLSPQLSFAQIFPPCEVSYTNEFLDINNVKAGIVTGGKLWSKIEIDTIFGSYSYGYHNGYEVPKGSGIQNMFAGGLWFGAYDDYLQPKVAVHFYPHFGNDFWPGPLDEDGLVTQEVCNNFDRLWKVNKSTIDSFRANLFTQIPESILDWPGRNNPFLPFDTDQELAPFVDVNNDGNYHPEHGDYPKILGDQSIWQIFNDVGGNKTETYGLPVQLEIALEAFAFNSIPEFANHTFYRYKITNKSKRILTQARLGVWADIDLGQFNDDYLGCDSTRNLAIGYNGDAVDGEYGENIPMIGVKILQGPKKLNGDFANMTLCRFYHKDFGSTGWAEQAQQHIYNLQAKWSSGEPIIDDGRSIYYQYPGNPANPEEESECSLGNTPSELNVLMATEEFEMQPNDVQEFYTTVLWTQDNITYPCPSFAPIQQIADEVQDWFDNNELISSSITNISKHQEISLLGNPMKTVSIVSWEKTTHQVEQVKIYNTIGKLVRTYEIKERATKQLEINREQLTTGLYILEVETNKGNSISFKLLVD